MMESRLTLRAALAADQLEEFVKQEESLGGELSRGSEFERALALFLVQRGLRQHLLQRSNIRMTAPTSMRFETLSSGEPYPKPDVRERVLKEF